MNDSNFAWTKDLLLHMIDMYRQRPELWDHSSAYYSDKEKKETSWLEIANAINLNVDIVQRKIKILISQFRREQSRQPGYKSKWFAFKKMLFLGPRQPIARRSVKYSSQSDGGGGDGPPTYFISMAPNQLDEHSVEHNVSDTHRKEQIALKDILGNFEEPRRKERKKIQPEIFKQEPESVAMQEKDEYATYGELVAMKLRKLGSQYARSTAQYHINKILYKADIGEFDKRKRRHVESMQRYDSDDDVDVDKEFLKFENDDSDD